MSAVLRWPVSLALLLYQSVVLALAQIWTNKVRAFLTTLGILIGGAAVSAVIALITGMQERVIAEFEKFGANKLMISPQWRKQDFRDGGRWNVVFKPTDFDQMLRFCPSVENYTRDVGLGDDSDEPAILDDGQSPNLVPSHEPERLFEFLVGPDADEVLGVHIPD